jgi:MarR family transcriptional regulator for hemolysin
MTCACPSAAPSSSPPENGPDDRRAKTISLTDEGRAVTAEMEEKLVGLRAQVLKGVSRADLETTLRVLKAFQASDVTADTARVPDTRGTA